MPWRDTTAMGHGIGTVGAAGCFKAWSLVPELCLVAAARPFLAAKLAEYQATAGVVAAISLQA
jgi:hypothetical protein